jgi:hypothetical protein
VEIRLCWVHPHNCTHTELILEGPYRFKTCLWSYHAAALQSKSALLYQHTQSQHKQYTEDSFREERQEHRNVTAQQKGLLDKQEGASTNVPESTRVEKGLQVLRF